ncbi:MAG: hypothetical protein OEY49_19970, partial [Candidatus Heimdallarchaeota archaeon]|nr:hypothetical protein [Candidatus Heimdallarchaeota archaeon]
VKNSKLTQRLIASLTYERIDQFLSKTLVNEDKTNDVSSVSFKEIKNSNIKSTLYLFLAMVPFNFLLYIIYMDRKGEKIFENDSILIIFAISLTLLVISNIYMERADKIEEQIISQKELQYKVIRTAFTNSSIIKNKSTEMKITVHNPFKTKGMRIYLHSIDNVTPKSIVIPDFEPETTKQITFDYIALSKGNREIGLEFVQYSDESGNRVPAQKSKTFDQETIKLKVSGETVFGLSESQVNLIGRLITGIGAITIAISFLANAFAVTLDPNVLQTTIPIIILLQSPVVWLVLFFNNKLSKSFTTND